MILHFSEQELLNIAKKLLVNESIALELIFDEKQKEIIGYNELDYNSLDYIERSKLFIQYKNDESKKRVLNNSQVLLIHRYDN